MVLTYKYKLYHSKRLRKLHRTINIAGVIYNHCVALHKRYYRLYGKYLNKHKLQKHITKLKKLERFSFWKLVPSQAIQDITDRIDRAYSLFFKYIKKRRQGLKPARVSPPGFRKIRKYRSYTLKQAGYRINGNTIRLGGQKFKFWLSRPITGRIKTVTVKRDNLGDFYICIALEKDLCRPVNTAPGKIVGIDFGLKTFLTLSDGSKIESPQYYLAYLRRLQKQQRKLSRKKKESSHRAVASRKVARLHKKVADCRRDFFHKTANMLAGTYRYIAVEDLNLKAIQKRWGRKVSDYAFGEFLRILGYKTHVTAIDRYYPSTKTCHACGYINDSLTLKDRTWQCPDCGALHDRDRNASINIERVGASTLGTDDVRLASLECQLSLP